MNRYILLLSSVVFLFFASCFESKRPDASVTEQKTQNVKTASSVKTGKVFSGKGIALVPRDFPRHTANDVQQMFVVGKELGDYSVFIYQWSDPDIVKIARGMMKSSKQFGLTPIIGLSPTILGGLRDKLDVPEHVRKKAGNKLSFANPAVHLPFIETTLELAKLKPPYLCLATEINLMAFKNIEEYKYFAFVYKKLYYEIKKISPSTKVFVSFQWDYFTILDNKDSGRISEHSKLIDIFRPELDLVAFTSYPDAIFTSPSLIPPDYYSRIHWHVKDNDEIMFMEIGWPATGKAGENKQQEFIRLLPRLMKDVKPRIIAWSLLHDVGGVKLSDNLATTGLLTKRGGFKAGFKAFKELGQTTTSTKSISK